MGNNEEKLRGLRLGMPDCSCTWDLDQLIGEEGCDDVILTVTLKQGTVLTCPGRSLKRELDLLGVDDPNDVVQSIQM